MNGQVIKGDYKGKLVLGTVTRKVNVVLGIRRKLPVNSETVESYEIVDEGTKGSGKAIAGGLLFGGAGAVVGANSSKAKNILVKINFKDGKKSLVRCDKLLHTLIVENYF